jgi:hypothetical protein
MVNFAVACMGLNPSQISFLVLTPVTKILVLEPPEQRVAASIITVQPFTCRISYSSTRYGSMLMKRLFTPSRRHANFSVKMRVKGDE